MKLPHVFRRGARLAVILTLPLGLAALQGCSSADEDTTRNESGVTECLANASTAEARQAAATLSTSTKLTCSAIFLPVVTRSVGGKLAPASMTQGSVSVAGTTRIENAAVSDRSCELNIDCPQSTPYCTGWQPSDPRKAFRCTTSDVGLELAPASYPIAMSGDLGPAYRCGTAQDEADAAGAREDYAAVLHAAAKERVRSGGEKLQLLHDALGNSDAGVRAAAVADLERMIRGLYREEYSIAKIAQFETKGVYQHVRSVAFVTSAFSMHRLDMSKVRENEHARAAEIERVARLRAKTLFDVYVEPASDASKWLRADRKLVIKNTMAEPCGGQNNVYDYLLTSPSHVTNDGYPVAYGAAGTTKTLTAAELYGSSHYVLDYNRDFVGVMLKLTEADAVEGGSANLNCIDDLLETAPHARLFEVERAVTRATMARIVEGMAVRERFPLYSYCLNTDKASCAAATTTVASASLEGGDGELAFRSSMRADDTIDGPSCAGVTESLSGELGRWLLCQRDANGLKSELIASSVRGVLNGGFLGASGYVQRTIDRLDQAKREHDYQLLAAVPGARQEAMRRFVAAGRAERLTRVTDCRVGNEWDNQRDHRYAFANPRALLTQGGIWLGIAALVFPASAPIVMAAAIADLALAGVSLYEDQAEWDRERALWYGGGSSARAFDAAAQEWRSARFWDVAGVVAGTIGVGTATVTLSQASRAAHIAANGEGMYEVSSETVGALEKKGRIRFAGDREDPLGGRWAGVGRFRLDTLKQVWPTLVANDGAVLKASTRFFTDPKYNRVRNFLRAAPEQTRTLEKVSLELVEAHRVNGIISDGDKILLEGLIPGTWAKNASNRWVYSYKPWDLSTQILNANVQAGAELLRTVSYVEGGAAVESALLVGSDGTWYVTLGDLSSVTAPKSVASAKMYVHLHPSGRVAPSITTRFISHVDGRNYTAVPVRSDIFVAKTRGLEDFVIVAERTSHTATDGWAKYTTADFFAGKDLRVDYVSVAEFEPVKGYYVRAEPNSAGRVLESASVRLEWHPDGAPN